MVKINILGKKITYESYKDELYYDNMTLRLINDSTFKRVLMRDCTDKFISSMKKVVDPNHLHEMNSIWSMSGLTGTGKSIAVMSLLKLIVPSRFSYKNFCFFDEEILELAKEVPRDSFIVRDEGTQKGVFGVGSTRQSAMLSLITEVSRKRGLSLCFIEPTEKPNDIVKWYLETIDMDIENRITRVALKEPRTMQYVGAIYVPVLPESDPDWINYNLRKDKFIEDTTEGKMTGAKSDPLSLAKQIFEEVDTELYRTKKERKAFTIQKYPTYTSGEIELILTHLEILIRQKNGY